MTSPGRISNLEYALMLARMGFKVLPCCWPGLTGKCACPKEHGGTPKMNKAIGKAPLTRHGLSDATNDPVVIKHWWSLWPFANVAIDLAGYIMVDPDSDDAQLEAEELGLPLTLKRISNFDAYIFRALEGIRTARLTNKGKSGEIDVFSNGYCLAYGRHRSGCEIYLEDLDMLPVDAPDWVTNWIATAPEPIEVKPRDSSRPPVRLRPTATEWWNGTRFKENDRSTTLFQIGLFLAEANASADVIADSLAERDITLGYEKYSGRSDAQTRYLEIAHKAIAAQARPNQPRIDGEVGHQFRTLPAYQVTIRP